MMWQCLDKTSERVRERNDRDILAEIRVDILAAIRKDSPTLEKDS